MIYTKEELERLTKSFLVVQKHVSRVMMGSKSGLASVLFAYSAAEFDKKPEEEITLIRNNLLTGDPKFDGVFNVGDALLYLLTDKMFWSHITCMLSNMKMQSHGMYGQFEPRDEVAFDVQLAMDYSHLLGKELIVMTPPRGKPKLGIDKVVTAEFSNDTKERYAMPATFDRYDPFWRFTPNYDSRRYDNIGKYYPDPQIEAEYEFRRKPEYAVKPQKRTTLLHRNNNKAKVSKLLSNLVKKAT